MNTKNQNKCNVHYMTFYQSLSDVYGGSDDITILDYLFDFHFNRRYTKCINGKGYSYSKLGYLFYILLESLIYKKQEKIQIKDTTNRNKLLTFYLDNYYLNKFYLKSLSMINLNNLILIQEDVNPFNCLRNKYYTGNKIINIKINMKFQNHKKNINFCGFELFKVTKLHSNYLINGVEEVTKTLFNSNICINNRRYLIDKYQFFYYFNNIDTLFWHI